MTRDVLNDWTQKRPWHMTLEIQVLVWDRYLKCGRFTQVNWMQQAPLDYWICKCVSNLSVGTWFNFLQMPSKFQYQEFTQEYPHISPCISQQILSILQDLVYAKNNTTGWIKTCFAANKPRHPWLFIASVLNPCIGAWTGTDGT